MNSSPNERGMVSVMAMLFLAIFASLATAMAMSAQANLLSADTQQRGYRALSAAETGVQFARFRLSQIAATVTTTEGDINGEIAADLWSQVAVQLYAVVGAEDQFLDSPAIAYGSDGVPARVELGRLRLGSDANEPTVRITVAQHPIDGEEYGAAYYQRMPYAASVDNPYTADGAAVSATNPVTNNYLRLAVVGADGPVERTVRVDMRLDKKVRFAILSRNRVMLGRNVMVVGPIGSRYTRVDHLHGHPVQMRDNFHGLDSQLDAWLGDLKDYLSANDQDGDNRINLEDAREAEALGANAANLDANGDGHVDTYDMFLLKYDADGDGALTEAEFTSGGALVDDQLWKLMNEAKYPIGTEFDWDAKLIKLPGGEWTDASADLAVINNDDDYAKVHGDVVFKAAKADWEAGAAEGPYQEYFRGPILPDEYTDAVTFGASDDDLVSLEPAAFDLTAYRAASTGDFAAQAATPTAANPDEPATYAPPSTDTIESVPYNSPYPYDHYERPVYTNMVFTDVTIPKGTNALFVGCRFEGVTFVDTATDNGDPNFNYAGMQEADGSQVYDGVTAEVDGAAVADTKPLGNNLRFHNCTFEGVVVTETPDAFSHVRNKLQFTGDTRFDLDAPGMSAEQKTLYEKSTILAPQYSLDIGTFTQPASGTEVTHLEGTIVAGVLDVRGQAEINGSIITTFEPTPGEGVLTEGGNPANFNTTLGYFESTAGDSEAELPNGGYGKIIIRYDPYRPMPDGIRGPIEVKADMATYFEGGL
jgi:hypothetical protein